MSERSSVATIILARRARLLPRRNRALFQLSPQKTNVTSAVFDVAGVAVTGCGAVGSNAARGVPASSSGPAIGRRES